MSDEEPPFDKDDQMYIYKLFGVSTPRRIKATDHLRQKIGPIATIDEKKIAIAQRNIDTPKIDYAPYALDLVKALRRIIEELRSMDYDREREYNRVSGPIAQLKGESAMFGNTLSSVISAKVLRFLEHFKRLDNDVMDILEAYCHAITIAYEKSLNDPDTPQARKLSEELNGAMERYIAKFRRRTET